MIRLRSTTTCSLNAEHGARAAVAALPDVVRRGPELSAEPAGLGGRDGELLAALAELCEVIGWILFDAGVPVLVSGSGKNFVAGDHLGDTVGRSA
ncbi:hypothetical protein ABT282_36995 [Streptomyces sp. NPDC000927]|uniref:hypothetical protein n=1 Tax=Streptomyces sp. NPDC000927 TaxID=3154371 RepID=UPI0033267AB3